MKILLLSLILISCSSKKGTVDSDSDELVIVHGNSIDKLFEGHQVGVVPRKPIKQVKNRTIASVSKTYDIFEFRDDSGILTKKVGEYIVKSNNETLMLLSYNLYGDFRYWKSIAKLNSDFLPRPFSLKKGMKLKYYLPKRDFVYRPDGEPFLIKRGHSLSKISNIVYENWRRWPEIYDNNKPMIKNPDKIYAGFTLYYLEDDNNLFSLSSRNKTLPKVLFKNDNKLFELMMSNINNSKMVRRREKSTPKTWSLERLKQKLKSKRVPSSVEETKSSPVAKYQLTEKEKKTIREIKQAVKVDQKRIKKEKAEESLLDKVKNSFKQFDYY